MIKKILLGIAAFIVVLIAVLGIAVATFDINQHRGEIEAALSKATGRSVKLGGTIHIGLSMKGVTVTVRDVAFGNPAWASRPNMASIALVDLKIGVLPLLSHRVSINGLALDNADIVLESADGDRHNWVMRPDEPPKGAPGATTPAGRADTSTAVSIHVTNLSIKNSRIAVRGDGGKMTVFKTDDFKLGDEGSGMGIHFSGSLNDRPIKLSATTGADFLTAKTMRPIAIDLTAANYHLTAQGKMDIAASRADFDSYELMSGDTKITGALAAAWGGARPVVQGNLASDNLNPADLAMTGEEQGNDAASAAPTPAPAPASQRLFGDQPLPFDALKAADVALDVAIAAMPAGSVKLQNIKGKLLITNGHLLLAPLTMDLGSGTINGQINLDASVAPAKLGMTFAVKDVDWQDIIKAWGAEAFLSGKVRLDMNLASSGNSRHELASNLSGPITMIGAGGDVISSAAGQLSSGLAELLSPGSSNKNEGMNCLVARFIAQNGVVRGNGILVDTSAVTAAGYGDIDLRSETINLDFHARPKLIDLGGLLPPLHIGGTLMKPSTRLDSNAMAQSIGKLLSGSSTEDGVPDVLTRQGQNACAYTLDHPSAVAAARPPDKGGLVQKWAGQAGNLMKGLFGK